MITVSNFILNQKMKKISPVSKINKNVLAWKQTYLSKALLQMVQSDFPCTGSININVNNPATQNFKWWAQFQCSMNWYASVAPKCCPTERWGCKSNRKNDLWASPASLGTRCKSFTLHPGTPQPKTAAHSACTPRALLCTAAHEGGSWRFIKCA